MGRRALVLLVALVLAGVAAFAVFQFLSGIQSEVEADREKVTVFRAGSAIPEGAQGSQILQQGVITQGEENTEDLPLGAVTSEEQLQAVLGGRLAVGPIDQNEIITTSQWAQLTVDLVGRIRERIRLVDFWRNAHEQSRLKLEIVEALDRTDLVPFARLQSLADRLVEQAKALHTRLTA